MKLTRREFLKIGGTTAALLGLGARLSPAPLVGRMNLVPAAPVSGNGMLIDTTKCIGCKSCQLACKKAKGLPTDDDPKALGPTALTFVDFRNVSTGAGKTVMKPVKRQCMHCNNPGCVSACTVGALQKTPNGPVVYDANKCIGCRYCMYACPFGVPTFEWDKQLSLIKKCDACAQLTADGEMPACAKACPTGALQYGKRDELLTIAKQRIDDPKGNYVKYVYGEKEVGGTSMLYLSSLPFDVMGFPSLPEEPPAEVSQLIMHSTPIVAAVVASVLTGAYLVTRSREDSHGSVEHKSGGH